MAPYLKKQERMKMVHSFWRQPEKKEMSNMNQKKKERSADDCALLINPFPRRLKHRLAAAASLDNGRTMRSVLIEMADRYCAEVHQKLGGKA